MPTKVEMVATPLSQHDADADAAAVSVKVAQFDPEDDEPPLSAWEKVSKKIVSFFGADDLGGFDMEDLSDRGQATWLLTLYLSFWMVVMVYLAVTGTITGMSTKYLGVEFNNDMHEVCAEVPLVSQGVYMADFDGNWETDPKFNANGSMFSLEFKASQIDNAQYQSLMSGYSQKLQDLGAKAKVRNVAWSWVAWSTMSFLDSKTNTRFAPVGDATDVYNLQISAAAVASWKGVCTNTVKGNYKPSIYGRNTRGDFTGAGFTISYPIMQDPDSGGLLVSGYDHTKFGPCSDQGAIQDVWSWTPAANPDFEYAASFDSKATTLILALNIGMVKKEDLLLTSSLYDPVDFLNLPKGQFYIDQNKVPMNPVYCLDDSIIAKSTSTVTRPDVCFYPYGRKPLLLYPVTSQVGPKDSVSGAPTPCKCTADKKDAHYADFNSTECNKPQILVGYVYNIDGSANKSVGTIKYALNMQTQVMNYGDDIIGSNAFNAMADSVYLFASNVNSQVETPYCPGGMYDSGNGDCLGLCSFDYKTSCTRDSDCISKNYFVGDDGPDAVQSAYLSDEGATCMKVCSTDTTTSCTTLAKASSDCPGQPGLGCIQRNYKSSNKKFYNTTKYYEVSYDPSDMNSNGDFLYKKAIRTAYPFNGSYDSTQGGCLCKGYPKDPKVMIASAANATAGDDDGAAAATATDDAGGGGSGGGSGNDDASGGSFSPPATDDVRRNLEEDNDMNFQYHRRLGSKIVVGSPITQLDSYTEKYPFVAFKGKVPYKNWCCPGITKCECTYTNGTAIFSPTRYNIKCCPDSTKCWCAGPDGKTPDGTYKQSCCPRAYDQICCDAGRKYDNGTMVVKSNIDDHFKAICPDKKCAAIVFLIDTTVGIFAPINLYNNDLRQISTQTYMETFYKFVKSTKTWVASGQKIASRIMCVDTFFFSDMMSGLAANPPMPLVQGYYNCHKTLADSVQAAIGNAAGAASLIANIAIAAVCFLWFSVYNTTKGEKGMIPKKKKEKMKARRKERAEAALHNLMGTIAEEYIGMKRKVAGTVKDEGIEKMADQLKFYYYFHNPERLHGFFLPEDDEDAAADGFESDGSENIAAERMREDAERQEYVGKRVGLTGLTPGSPYNDAIGKCTQYDAESDDRVFRVTIIAPNHIRGKRVKVRFENLFKPTPEQVQAARNAPPPGSDGLFGVAVPVPGCPQQ